MEHVHSHEKKVDRKCVNEILLRYLAAYGGRLGHGPGRPINLLLLFMPHTVAMRLRSASGAGRSMRPWAAA